MVYLECVGVNCENAAFQDISEADSEEDINDKLHIELQWFQGIKSKFNSYELPKT